MQDCQTIRESVEVRVDNISFKCIVTKLSKADRKGADSKEGRLLYE